MPMIVTVKTQEDFWRIHDYLELASKLDDGCDYSVFKHRIFPGWEARENMHGGRWIININSGGTEVQIDSLWEKLLTLMLKEETGLINGVVVRKKKNVNKMAIWLKDASKSLEVMKLGRRVKEKLGVRGTIFFKAHQPDIRYFKTINEFQ